MRHVIKGLAIFAAVTVLASSLAIAEELPWFNLEKCTMCKPLTEPPDLMNNMTWEHHIISNGIVSVTTVKDKHMKALRDAKAKMKQVEKRLEKGERVELCGMCTAIGQLIMKGARSESIETLHGDLWLLTSDDPDLVAEIQNWAKRTIEEMKKMPVAEQSKKE